MASGGTPIKDTSQGQTKDDFQKLITKVNENPDYKVLTKEEYESLLAIASHRDNKTSTPNTAVKNTQENVVKPKLPKVTFQNPGISPVPRLQFLFNNPQNPNSSQVNTSPHNPNVSQVNTSFTAQPYNYPKLPFFSGSEEPQKGETTYEVWNFEVKCLQNANYFPEHVLLQSIRNSLKGDARTMLVPLGEHASVSDILNKLDGFYGNVSTSETLIQSFYSDYQKDTESIVAYGSRLEQTLSRAIRCGHIELAAKDAMLRSKFWTGLKSQQLKNSTRHLYDSLKDFQTLLREIRKVDQEDSSSSRPSSKAKTAQQQSGQASVDDQSTVNTQLLKQMTELMARMKTLEQKVENRQDSSSNKPSYGHYYDNSFRGRGRFTSNRGFGRGNFGRGYQDNNYSANSQTSNRGNNNNRGGYRGGYPGGGYRGGTGARGANRGGNPQGDSQPLNF